MSNEETDLTLPYLVQFADFIVDQTNSRADAKRVGHSLKHLYYALTQLRWFMFTDTAARIESPFSHI